MKIGKTNWSMQMYEHASPIWYQKIFICISYSCWNWDAVAFSLPLDSLYGHIFLYIEYEFVVYIWNIIKSKYFECIFAIYIVWNIHIKYRNAVYICINTWRVYTSTTMPTMICANIWCFNQNNIYILCEWAMMMTDVHSHCIWGHVSSNMS